MTKRLYLHTTDGGAEYLCTSPVEGTNEGDMRHVAVRLDGHPELMGETLRAVNAFPALLDLLKTYVEKCDDNKISDSDFKFWSCGEFRESARAALAAAKGE